MKIEKINGVLAKAIFGWLSLSWTMVPMSLCASNPFPNQTHFRAASAADATSVIASPPNLNGWVGPTQYILMTYGALRSFDKKTMQPDGVLNTTAYSFFGFKSQDVRIDYDRYADRWFMSCQEQDPATGFMKNFVLAMSSEGIITDSTKWSFYKVPYTTLNPGVPAEYSNLDYSQLSTSEHAIVIGVRTFNKNPDVNSIADAVVMFQKSSLLAGNPVINVFPGLAPNNAAITPPDNFDSQSEFGYLSYPYYPPEDVQPRGKDIVFIRVINPGSAKPTLGPEIFLDLIEAGSQEFFADTYPLITHAPHKGNLFGYNGALQLFVPNSSTSASHVRDKQLYTLQVIPMNAAGVTTDDVTDPEIRFGIQWYQFDLTGDPTGNGQGVETVTTKPALVQWGTLHDPTTEKLSYFNPSIMTNKNHDMVITATVSGLNRYTDIVYATRAKADPLGTLNPPIVVTNNDSTLKHPYNYGGMNLVSNGGGIGQRWGDESSAVPDPTNDLDIWLTNEWAALYNAWGVETVVLSP